jgi:hypothetical protein
MACTYGATLEELIKRPTDLLVLVGAEDDPSDSDPDDSDDDDEDDDDDPSDSDDDDDEDDKDDDPSGDPKDKSKKKPSEQEQEIADLTAERDRHKKRRGIAEKRIDKLLLENADLKANGTKDETLKNELKAATETVAKLEPENQSLRLQVAFLSDNSVSWKDPEAALKLVDMSDVTFDDGKVEGLAPALRALAKAKPYLVAEKGSKPTPRKSGDTPSKKRTTEADKANKKKEFIKRYPALNK